MPKFNDFIKNFGEQEQAQPKKKYGGIAGDLQKAGFEPYEVNEKEDYLKVKNKDGKDFEIHNSGKGYNYNVFEDGKQTYQYVPNYKYFENIVGGKNLGEFEKYRVKEAPQEEVKPVKADSNDYPYDEEVLKGITRDTPDKAKKLAQALYAYRVTKDTDLAGKLFDEYLSK